MYSAWDTECDKQKFLSFWGHFFTFYPTPLSYGSWDMEFNGQNFFVIFDHFLLFYLPNNPKNLNFEKKKKAPGDIIILHMCTINGNHMMNGS